MLWSKKVENLHACVKIPYGSKQWVSSCVKVQSKSKEVNRTKSVKKSRERLSIASCYLSFDKKDIIHQEKHNSNIPGITMIRQYHDTIHNMLLVFLLFIDLMTTSLAFTETTMRGESMPALYESRSSNNGAIQKRAYNDDALFNFHMITQSQKIRDYSAMDTFVNTQSLWNLAWHDSFVRNGLADFVPPMTGELNVLVVSAPNQKQSLIDGEIYGLKDEFDAGDIAELKKVSATAATGHKGESSIDILQSGSLNHHLQLDSSCSFLSAFFDKESNNNEDTSTDSLEYAMYDCIMDEGLIADIIRDSTDSITCNKEKQDLARLLFEATKRIRESGIYVANTQPMSFEMKDYLLKLGDILGLQWEFELDGISDENLAVSVARKFGSCPKIGWQTMSKLLGG